MRISDWSSDVCSSDLAFLDELGQLLVAVTAGPVVRGQVAEIELAAAGWSQVAELGVQHQPALGHEPGFQGHVVVRREVDVDRLAPVEAVAAGLADGRVAQAGHAPVVEGWAGHTS